MLIWFTLAIEKKKIKIIEAVGKRYAPLILTSCPCLHARELNISSLFLSYHCLVSSKFCMHLAKTTKCLKIQEGSNQKPKTKYMSVGRADISKAKLQGTKIK